MCLRFSQLLLCLTLAWTLPIPRGWGQTNLTFPFTLEIGNLRSTEGQICLALFRTAEGFPDRGDLATYRECLGIPASPADQPIRFSLDLPYSNYAIAVFHDQNQNGQLDTGSFGIPKEGFGFSNNPQVRFGPPSFMDSRVLFTPQTTGTTIRLRYF